LRGYASNFKRGGRASKEFRNPNGEAKPSPLIRTAEP
jgi:hypothetical protein